MALDMFCTSKSVTGMLLSNEKVLVTLETLRAYQPLHTLEDPEVPVQSRHRLLRFYWLSESPKRTEKAPVCSLISRAM